MRTGSWQEKNVGKLNTQSRYHTDLHMIYTLDLHRIFRQTGINMSDCKAISGQWDEIEVQFHQGPENCGLSQMKRLK